MDSDISFITNEGEVTLSVRFERLLKQTKLFDSLVGYFYTSGFHNMYKSLRDVNKIRILVGIKTDIATFDLIQQAQEKIQKFSTIEVKENFSENTKKEIDVSDKDKETEEVAKTFIEWINNGKLEIRAYASERIHAKLYIMTFADGDRDVGRVITGSSNFTESGLVQNLEFNVELKNRADYDFALKKFNELWKNSVDVSKDYVETIEKKTWLNDNLTPYEVYLKFLYEYFKEKINKDQEEIFKESLPEGFMELEYQMEAVKDAKDKLEEYGGVFLSDVVGLGKTYISAMLAKQLDGGILVIAPPILLDENNPGSWKNVFLDFKVSAHFESVGKLDSVLKRDLSMYKNVFIDEAHRFRTETNITYENLARICSGKRVILVSATPLNNSPKDILSQIKLFQKPNRSTIPNQINLNNFFNKLKAKLEGVDRQTDYDKYIAIVKENSKEIRENVLKYLMVRRTRAEIEKYFGEDLKKRHLKFPNVADPEPVYYELSEKEDKIFNKTLELITSKEFTYARYTPFLPRYYTGSKTQLEVSQKNMRSFMRILLVKRLESSFYAFNKSIGRFINYYTQFISNFDKGKVYISKSHTEQIFEALNEGNEDFIDKLVGEKKAEEYKSTEFSKEFILNLKSDLKILQEIKQMWLEVKRDPKLNKLITVLQSREILKKNKTIIFTESKETANYLGENLPENLKKEAIVFSGESDAIIRDKVIENFDAKARKPKNDYRILITTEVLSEGVNLHRSNIVINYDIPWNPTRMMQRVGRINRIDTKFDEIYTFNFFPTTQSNNVIKLEEAAEAKIHAFIEMLGADAKLLTEGEEIKSQSLFKKINSKQTITGEYDVEDSELKYLMEIRDIRDKDPTLFEHVKNLPKKARTSKLKMNNEDSSLISYFRKGKLQKFFLADKSKVDELDFESAAKILYSKKDDKKSELKSDYYELLDKNKQKFKSITTEKVSDESILKGGRDKTTMLLRMLNSQEIKNFKGFTEYDEEYLEKVKKVLSEGINEQTLKTLVKALAKEDSPLKILAKVRINLPEEFFNASAVQSAAKTSGSREVILSVYLSGDNNG
jgi:superfamily II DNA or RNA helicase